MLGLVSAAAVAVFLLSALQITGGDPFAAADRLHPRSGVHPLATGSSAQTTAAAQGRSSRAAAAAAPARSALASSSPSAKPGATGSIGSGSGYGGSVVAEDGTVDAAKYRSLATDMASETGVAYRFGVGATSPASGAPTAFQPADKVLKNADRADQTYQVAGPQDPSKNDYSSDQGQLGYLSAGRQTFGADTVETLAMGENTFSEKPQLSWTFYGGGHPATDLVGDGLTAKCLAQQGLKPGNFVAQARAYAHGEATANSLMVFDNGVVAAAGTNTAPGRLCLQLPKDLHPTAISLTDGNEFALVTVWNTATLHGELAVIALAGAQPSGFSDFDFKELYPGFQNYGMPTFGKFIGTVVLPEATPTGVSAVSDYSGGKWLTDANGANVNPGQLSFSDESARQTFMSGKNSSERAKAGYAVVFSREEHKVSFVDLQPLFDSITGAYFGDRSKFQAAVDDIGQGAAQWPLTFANAPAEVPEVVKTVVTAEAPTAVAGMLSGAATPRAYVATVDGALHVFDVAGLASEQAITANQIVEKGVIPVGKNPTGITYVKDRPLNTKGLDSTLIVTARGSQAVQWVTLDGDSGSVTRTLRDSRMVDPIVAEDDNTHGTESWVVSIADFNGGKLLNYRFGDVVFTTNGGAVFGTGASGKDDFEFGGSYDPSGKPFSISVTNVV